MTTIIQSIESRGHDDNYEKVTIDKLFDTKKDHKNKVNNFLLTFIFTTIIIRNSKLTIISLL